MLKRIVLAEEEHLDLLEQITIITLLSSCVINLSISAITTVW
jgi:hypothetical protein